MGVIKQFRFPPRYEKVAEIRSKLDLRMSVAFRYRGVNLVRFQKHKFMRTISDGVSEIGYSGVQSYSINLPIRGCVGGLEW